MSWTVDALLATPNPLASHYARFRVSERVLLTGHSHQAWPDPAAVGHERAFEDAATWVDGKWERAMAQAERVRQGYRQLLDDPSGLFALGASTHELLVRLLSALPWSERPKLVTTDAEFYSLRRQLDRLQEAGIEVVRVAAHPAESVGERLADHIDGRTAAAVSSTVFFSSGHIAGELSPAAKACRRHGAILILDAYHQLNVVPLSLSAHELEDAYVVGGGYKYCQLGEGNAFLRFPTDCNLRPVVTGWFADFDSLSAPRHSRFHTDIACRGTVPAQLRAGQAGPVRYGTGSNRFAGATYDPTSHYRAAEVFAFFETQQLRPPLLRALNQRHLQQLIEAFDALDLDPEVIDRDRSVALSRRGGFLTLKAPRATTIQRQLLAREIHTDARGDVLRLGPAPYLSTRQLSDGVEALAEVVAAMA